MIQGRLGDMRSESHADDLVSERDIDRIGSSHQQVTIMLVAAILLLVSSIILPIWSDSSTEPSQSQ